MTPFLPEFAELRPHGVYDAELIAFGDDGRPDFRSCANGYCIADRASRSR